MPHDTTGKKTVREPRLKASRRERRLLGWYRGAFMGILKPVCLVIAENVRPVKRQ
jgi:hypothetical protein